MLMNLLKVSILLKITKKISKHGIKEEQYEMNNASPGDVKPVYFLNMENSEIRAIFRTLEKYQKNLTPYQAEFSKGLKKYYTRNNILSSKQMDALLNIFNSVMVEK